ncbi:hypothetical protein [Neobacillus massiliamazoniensis]|uniref:Uncharacterized protein n=1 Tax=Neobacillus massiliamazoniensis TaxID=1499688 RepID=A0A0U1NQJ1_9BACI|nr:hypothetical protein [Neobacillus massiliamazoniensis]CRK80310.1 hypothetical protein BN000_00191 [Neobacillus massiliamazoniensis]
MAYKVVNEFIDTHDNNTHYLVGEEYPKTGSKPTKKRIEELSKPHPEYKCVFIEEVKAEKKAKE